MDHDEDDLSVTGSGGKSETESTTPGSRKQRVASPLIGCRGTCFAVAVLAAARTFMQIAPRAGWAFGFMHSVLVGEFASVESTRLPSLSLSLSLSFFPLLSSFLSSSLSPRLYALSIFTFYPRRIPASTCTYIHRAPPRNARQYRPICIRDVLLQALSKFPFPPRANQPLLGRAIPPLMGAVGWNGGCRTRGSTKSIVCAKITGTLGNVRSACNLG